MGRDRSASAWTAISRMSTIRDMRMSDAVEWSIHCCTVLAALPEDQALPAARLAEFHDVPPAYLAKALQAMTAAGIVESRPGPRGGYRLARPAVGRSRCSTSCWPSTATTRPSGAARSASADRRRPTGSPRLPPAVRHRAGDVAGRGRLAGRAGGRVGRRHRHRALRDRARRAAGARGRVDPGRRRTTKEQNMKMFVAGGTGVVGRAAVPRLVAAGHEVRGAARSPEKADQLRAQGAEPVTVDLFDPAAVRGRGRRVPGRGPPGHQHPAAHQGVEGRRLGDQRPAPPRGRPASSSTPAATPGCEVLRARSRSSSPTSTAATQWIDEDWPVERAALQRRLARRRGRHARLHRRRSPRAWCCGSASSTPTTPVPSRRA